MKSRILATLLALCVVGSSIPMTAEAAVVKNAGDSESTQIVALSANDSQTMTEVTIAGQTYYVIDTTGLESASSLEYTAGTATKQFGDLTQIGSTNVYYYTESTEDLSAKTYYGTATLSYAEYYAGDTTVTEYDAVSSATTTKYKSFSNADVTDVTGSGYKIQGVKNVSVAVNAKTYVEAQLLSTAGALPENGVYVEAAGITLNEDADTVVNQYKTLNSNGTYSVTNRNVADTVTDAKATLKTTSVWGDYEIDVTETSTSYLRNTRSDNKADGTPFEVNSQIQGIIVKAEKNNETISVGLRHMEEIWIQPYELSFKLDSNSSATGLVGATVKEITYLMPDAAYVYTFDGIYMKPQIEDKNSFTAAFAEDRKSINVDLTNLPSDLENPKVTVYYKQGRSTTYYVQNAEAVDGVVTLDSQVPYNKAYTVVLSSDNYADKALTASVGQGNIADCTVKLAQSSYTYDGTAKKPAVTIEGLTENTDYTVSYSNNVNAGTATVTVTGIGDYTGTKTATFTIAPKAITASQVSAIKSYTYTGKAITPAVTINGLKSGTDYTVSYSNNINAGTAKVTITGKGNYTGTATVNFTINKKAAKITASNFKKTVGASAFKLNAKVDSKGKLSYASSNKKIATVSSAGKVTLKKNAIGKVTITITAKETTNYKKATKKITVTVAPKSVSGLKATSTSAKKVKVTWKKSSNITGYQIQYSTNKNFKKAKTINVKSAKTKSTTISKLSSKKKYYVRIRAYKTVSKTKYYSDWSKAASVKVR